MSLTVADFVEKVKAGDVRQYGTKGMRWGVRKDRPSTSGDAAKAAVLKTQARKSGVKTLSNDDLKELNKRLELETKYKTWAEKNPTLAQQAKKFVVAKLTEEGLNLVKAELGKKGGTDQIIRDFARKMNQSGSKKPPAPKTNVYDPKKAKKSTPAKIVPVHKITELN